MAAPYPLLMKKRRNDGLETTVISTEAQFGMVVSELPFHFVGNPKAPAVRDWPDENGKDVYLPDSGLPLSSYDMEVTFMYKGVFDTMSVQFRSFIEYLRGGDNNGSSLTIFDTYNHVGRQDVYLKSVAPEFLLKQRVANKDGEEIARFKLTFEVCDPSTDVTLTLP